MKILMVCLGNICRSPMAEGILQDKSVKAGFNWKLESAGTNGFHTGEPPHPISVKVAKQNGIDISGQKSRRFIDTDIEEFDFIYAMSSDVLENMKQIAGKKFDPKKVDLLLNELHAGENRDVPDPWYGPEQGYHEMFAIVNEACDSIVKKYLTAKEKKYA